MKLQSIRISKISVFQCIKLAGIPQVYYLGQEGQYNILIMDLLGDNLETLRISCGGKFNLYTGMTVMCQVLTRLESLHNACFIHKDLKPENLAIGLKENSATIYLFDFGLTKYYKNPRTNKHIEYTVNNKFTGTIKYASINTYLGYEQSRRDDLESLGLVCINLVKGSLPWDKYSGVSSKEVRRRVLTEIIGTSFEELCKGLPSIFLIIIDEFLKYFRYVRELEFTQNPDYNYLRDSFNDFIRKEIKIKQLSLNWINV